MTRVDLLRRLTKPTAANDCRPKGYARLSAFRRSLDLHQPRTPIQSRVGPTARNAAHVTSATGC